MFEENERQLKRECFNDHDTALKAVCKHGYIFSSKELVGLARKHRGVAIHINFNDELRKKIDIVEWLEVMYRYSWDAALQNSAETKNRYVPILL